MMDLVSKIQVDLLKEIVNKSSLETSDYSCVGNRDEKISRWIINNFELKKKDKRFKSRIIELDAFEYQTFDEKKIRSILGSEQPITSLEILEGQTVFMTTESDVSSSELQSLTTFTSPFPNNTNDTTETIETSNSPAHEPDENESLQAAVSSSSGMHDVVQTSLQTLYESLDNEGLSKSAADDELYLLGYVDADQIEFTVSGDNARDETIKFKQNIYDFLTFGNRENDLCNIRLVTIFLNTLLSDSVIASFSAGDQSTEEIMKQLNSKIYKQLVDEMINNQLDHLGNEIKCKIMYMSLKKLARKQTDGEQIIAKLSTQFNEDTLNSTRDYFKNGENETKFDNETYAEFKIFKKNLFSSLNYYVNSRSYLAISYLHGIQCSRQSDKAQNASTDKFYFEHYEQRERNFLHVMSDQLEANNQEFFSKVLKLFNSWRTDEIVIFLRPTLNNDSENDDGNFKFHPEERPLSRKITRLTERNILPVDYSKLKVTLSKAKRKKIPSNYASKRKMSRKQERSLSKKDVIRVILKFIFEDQLGTPQYLMQFIDTVFSSSNRMNLFGISMNKDTFISTNMQNLSSDLMNLFLEHLNFILYLTHQRIKTSLNCIFFSTVFIKYLIDNEECVNTWDDHFDFGVCKLIFIPIHLIDNEDESWSLVVISLNLIDPTTADIFLFVSEKCDSVPSKTEPILSIIKVWLQHKMNRKDLKINTEIILLSMDLNFYAIIDVIINIAFNYRNEESFDIDSNISTHIKEIKTTREALETTKKRFIHICCDGGTIHDLNTTNNPNYFKKAIEEMINNRSEVYKNKVLNFNDYVNLDLVLYEGNDDNDSDGADIVACEALEKKLLPSFMLMSSFEEKLNFLRKKYNVDEETLL